MQWMVPKERLDATQTRILNEFHEFPEYFYVSGNPGTGKSVLLVHFVREVKLAHPEMKICVLTFTHALRKVLEDGIRMSDVEVMTFSRFDTVFKRKKRQFDLIVVDEVQDMQHPWANTIQGNAPKVLFFGDFGQSLYEDTVTESTFTAQFQPTRRNLDYIHRLPPTIRDLVNSLFPGSPIRAHVSNLAGDSQIRLFHAETAEDEFSFLEREAPGYASNGSPTGILFRHRKDLRAFLSSFGQGIPVKRTERNTDYDAINAWFRKKGKPFRFLGNEYGDLSECDEQSIVFVMTWHSSKGLDFETVFLPRISGEVDQTVPFYVALTRARLNLILSCSGEDDSLVHRIKIFPGTIAGEVSDIFSPSQEGIGSGEWPF